MLFSDRSVITMVHGIVVSGGAIAGLAAALFGMILLRARMDGTGPAPLQT